MSDEPKNYTQAQLDEIVANRLREQSERSWAERVNGGLEHLSQQQESFNKSFVDLAETNRGIHVALTNLLGWQADQMQVAKQFHSDQMTPEMRGAFFDLVRGFLWFKSGWKLIAAIWGVTVVVVAPVVSAIVAKTLGVHIP